ncbi:bifunctional metallophosphatase/5'-nucleotidase [Nonomuraea aridisoli]|uniref:Bifunctional metallophosphatase/5'-nucleotidase n=1 Tax=Nonomuraea aridisoli TaxID=2070368 RepID=A0A2W2ETH5_9ACTN|nr:bifunctional metallophosphatase/5'-nucleotidase [Nonomuraea aridisoli]PZG20069.1 bifunctional metallophosphatase/5'-nucleotidase [Nonomuraea aridisoli]
MGPVLTGPTAFLSAALAVSALQPGVAQAAAPVDVQLLSITDLHGYLTPQNDAVNGTVKDAQGNSIVVGGAPYIATHLKNLRQGHQNSITFTSGDDFSGWPTEVAYHQDEPTVEFLNAIGVEFAAVGNHELDRSLEFLRDHMGKGRCFGEIDVDSCFTDSTGRRFRGADYTISSANITRKGSTKPIFQPYVIKQVKVTGGGNVRIGFINLTTPTTVTGSTSYQPELDNLPLVETANRYAAELKRRGVEAIVANVHEGGTAGDVYDRCGAPSGPVFDFAEQASPDIDAIITGHWHALFNDCVVPDPAGNPRPVVEAANHGRLPNEMNLKIDPRTGDVIRSATTTVNHPVTRDVTPDPAMTRLVGHWKARAADGESTLGNLVADAQYADAVQTSGGPVDLALVATAPLTGSNSLRGDLRFAKGADPADRDGTVLFGEAWSAYGYANPVLTVSLTGRRLEQALEQQWQAQADGTVRFSPLAVSAGVRYSYDASRQVGDRVDPSDVLIGDAPLDPGRTYRVAALAYTLIGADGFTALTGFTDPVRGSRDYDAFRAYLQSQDTTAPPALDRVTAAL